MSPRVSTILAAALVVFTTMPAVAFAQDLEGRVETLEEMVRDLLERNQDLESQVEELSEAAEESDGLTDEAISQIEQMLAERGALSRQWNTLLAKDGGFVDRIVYSGESRTRFDFRANTADLLKDLDDTGFRLDYRFNFGVGFNLAPDIVDGDSVPVKVKTWIEFQASGRGANNTAEDIRSGIGVSIGDFATRENDLDVVRLYQAYVLLEDIFGVESLEFKAGRQELFYGSQSILGSNEFFTGTVHDAIRLDFDIEAVDGHISIFYAKEAASDGQVPPGLSTGGLVTAQFRSAGDEDELMGVYMEFSPEAIDPLQFDLYWVFFNAHNGGPFIAPSNVTSPTDPAIDAFGRNTLSGSIHTMGLWIRGEDLFTEGLFLSAEFAFQAGETETRRDISAFFFEFAAEYALPFLSEVDGRVYFSYYWAQGNDDGPGTGFAPLFQSRHNNDPIRNHGAYSRLGNIDLIPNTNIHVFQGGLKLRPADDWLFGITYLYAFLDRSRDLFAVNALGNVFLDDQSFGHEIDLYARYQVNLQTDVFFNVSIFLPEADFFIQQVNGNGIVKADTEVAFGAYMQIQVRF